MTNAECAELARIAERAMTDGGFIPYPPAQAVAEAQASTALQNGDGAKDLSALPWTSIDNTESRDLDQIEAVESVDGGTKLYVGIADVEHLVPFGKANDQFASNNTTSVYTGVRTFPMLPERFSFDLTSLLAGQKRLTMVIETMIGSDGLVKSGAVYPAWTINKAKLAYPTVSDWLDGKIPPPPGLEDKALQEQVRLQDVLAKSLNAGRKRLGALDIDTHEVEVVTDSKGLVSSLAPHPQTRAGDIIEELMIVSNTTLAKELDARGQASIRRVVKQPERWAKIVAYAAGFGVTLPQAPHAKALSDFAEKMSREKPDRFAEISLALVKLIGRGEYEAHRPGEDETGHFAMAANAYTHSTAPNRRYVDLVTQRLVKRTRDYSYEQLAAVAAHCSEQEAAAKKVERQVAKSVGAMLLKHRVGEVFDGVVTGASPKGTWARIFDVHVEGKIVAGEKGLSVGDRVRVRLVEANPARGFIDFNVAS
ncbi:MAG TPA: RNB domain-containing ribonuclease [Elusimicrobiota bacterium]|nr:RNB domain-containing ribonuclease [Elusimicrobiota bacterium]